MTTPAPETQQQQRRRKSARYAALSRRALQHAQEQLDQGDTVQASEKAYGAVSCAVKSYGELRGWNHYNHHRVGLILTQLREEENDSELVTAFAAVKALHNNFFEYELESVVVQDHIDTAKTLVERLETLGRSAPNPLPPESLNRERRRRMRLLLQPPAEGAVPVEDLPDLEELPG